MSRSVHKSTQILAGMRLTTSLYKELVSVSELIQVIQNKYNNKIDPII